MPLSFASFGRLVAELGRRRVFRTAALYLIVALVAIEVTEALTIGGSSTFVDLPLRTVTMVAWAAILGFPITVGLAWTYDVTPAGIVRTGPESETERRRRDLTRRVGYRLMMTGIAAAAVGATTWVVMEPFLPEVEVRAAIARAAAAPVGGDLHVHPVGAAEGVDPALAERATLLLLARLADESDLRPFDPRAVPAAGAGDAVSDAALLEAGAGRVLTAELVRDAEGLLISLRATLRWLGEDPVEPAREVRVSGPEDDLESMVDQTVAALAAPPAATTPETAPVS